ncbi:universal stress protein [Hymenobacter sp. BT664]|uniref:Universal stress protein n=1 Tax=Hymenobacter montanus TaxID=2771359 RepID=A0A927BD19_9BACT|nr:universal stress protein [Hymenobacter montanus]MBD2767914.1 universal stress protein [Hymenobacter montanus]
MQTILVPIDFSAASENALVYANKLALRLPAEIVLVHSRTGRLLPAEQQTAVLHRLKALAERVRYQQLTRQSGRRISYRCHVSTEPLAEALAMLVADYRASLVVAGLTLNDCATNQAPGSPLALLPERVSCPVLLVPLGRHELASRIVISGNFAGLDGSYLQWLKPLASPAGAHFNLVQFHAPTSAGLAPLKKALISARAHFADATVHLLPEEDTLEGLSDFSAEHGAQLLVVTTADGCLVRRFFNPHYTKTNAYHLRIPVLLLPTSTEPTPACCEQCSLRQAAEARLQAYLLELT